MISTRSPIAASAVPRLMAVVVLPTPPFWLAMASTRGGLAGSAWAARSTTWLSGAAASGCRSGDSDMDGFAFRFGPWAFTAWAGGAPSGER